MALTTSGTTSFPMKSGLERRRDSRKADSLNLRGLHSEGQALQEHQSILFAQRGQGSLICAFVGHFVDFWSL